MNKYRNELIERAKYFIISEVGDRLAAELNEDLILDDLIKVGQYLDTRPSNAHVLAMYCYTYHAIADLLLELEKTKVSPDAVRKRLVRAKPRIIEIFKEMFLSERSKQIEIKMHHSKLKTDY